jgi:hypothetical protein
MGTYILGSWKYAWHYNTGLIPISEDHVSSSRPDKRLKLDKKV